MGWAVSRTACEAGNLCKRWGDGVGSHFQACLADRWGSAMSCKSSNRTAMQEKKVTECYWIKNLMKFIS